MALAMRAHASERGHAPGPGRNGAISGVHQGRDVPVAVVSSKWVDCWLLIVDWSDTMSKPPRLQHPAACRTNRCPKIDRITALSVAFNFAQKIPAVIDEYRVVGGHAASTHWWATPACVSAGPASGLANLSEICSRNRCVGSHTHEPVFRIPGVLPAAIVGVVAVPHRSRIPRAFAHEYRATVLETVSASVPFWNTG